MWTSIVGALLKSVAPKVADYYIKKVELKQQIRLRKLEGKIAYEEAKTRRAEASEGRDAEWELESLRNAGWKDDWVLVVMSIPMILVFIPYTQPFIMQGFAVLADTPVWYRTTVITIYLATFGIRLWRRDVRNNQGVAQQILESSK